MQAKLQAKFLIHRHICAKQKMFLNKKYKSEITLYS
jgi:hypothetical protein